MAIANKQLVSLCKKDLVNIYKHAIEAVKPDTLVKKAIKLENNSLILNEPLDSSSRPIKFDLKGRRIHVIGGGKCVLGMAKGLAEICQPVGGELPQLQFSHGCLSLPIGLRGTFENDKTTKTLLDYIGVTCMFGSDNNLPDMNSVGASSSILRHIAEACNRDQDEQLQSLFVVLISGGGSANLTSPRSISLDEKVGLIKQLAQRGADIVELNKVRSYFSNIKAGNLARYILKRHPKSQILSLILSDVIGDPIEFIASGPTFLNQMNHVNHYNSMIGVIKKYKLDDSIPSSSQLFETNEKDSLAQKIFERSDCVINRIIGSNKIAIEAASERAKELGYSVEVLGDSMHGPSRVVVSDMIKFGNKQFGKGSMSSHFKQRLVIGGGEATVDKEPNEQWGKGGRAQEMAIDYMILKLSNRCEDSGSIVDLFLAGGTDGQDGPTDVAGCMASLYELKLLDESFSLNDIRRAKSLHDSYHFWHDHKPDWLIKTGMTGTNVMDLYFYLTVDI